MFTIGDAVRDGISLEKIKAEIEKCIVLCANCHAIRHFNMRSNKGSNSGIEGEFEEISALLEINPEEALDN